MLLGDERRVARVDIASRKILSTAKLPFIPGGIATGGGSAWVTEDGGDGLVRLDGTTGAIARRFSIPARGDRGRSPTGVAFGAGSVWVARTSETVRVAPGSGAVEQRFPTPLSTTSVVFAGGNVWAAGSENGRIVRIDPVTNRITAVTPLHGTVTDLAVDRDSVWVSIVPDDVVFRLSPDDGSVLATIPAGDGAVNPVGRGRGVDRRREGARDRPGEHGRDTRATAHHRHAVGGPLPRRPAVGLGRRVRARRVRRDDRDAPDPARHRRHRPRRPGRHPWAGLQPAGLLDLRVPPELPGRRGGRRPRAPAGGRGRDARRLGGRPDVPVPRAPWVPLLAALGRGGHRRDVPAHHRACPLAPARPGRGAEPQRPCSWPTSRVRPRTPRAGRPTSAASRPGATRSRSGSRARPATSPRGSARPPSARCPSARRTCREAARRRAHRHGGALLRRLGGRGPGRRGEEPELQRQPAAPGRAHRLHRRAHARGRRRTGAARRRRLRQRRHPRLRPGRAARARGLTRSLLRPGEPGRPRGPAALRGQPGARARRDRLQHAPAAVPRRADAPRRRVRPRPDRARRRVRRAAVRPPHTSRRQRDRRQRRLSERPRSHHGAAAGGARPAYGAPLRMRRPHRRPHRRDRPREPRPDRHRRARSTSRSGA